jgi:hypothetical protein
LDTQLFLFNVLIHCYFCETLIFHSSFSFDMDSYLHRQAYEEDGHPNVRALGDSDDLEQVTVPPQDFIRNERLGAYGFGHDTSGSAIRASQDAGHPAKRPRPDSGEAPWLRRQQVLEWIQQKASSAQVDMVWTFIQGRNQSVLNLISFHCFFIRMVAERLRFRDRMYRGKLQPVQPNNTKQWPWWNGASFGRAINST